jgi:parvulin-like peptidyl-prolyl isomerase
MKILLTLGIVSALSLSAQTQAPAPTPAAEKPPASAPAAPVAKPGLQITPGTAPNTYQVNIPVVQSIPLTKLPPTFVVATVDGQPITAGQLQAVLLNVPAPLQQKIEGDRKEFIRQYVILSRFAEMARKDKLDQQSPYKEAIDYQTMIVLYGAVVEQKGKEQNLTPEDIKNFYDTHQDRYDQVKFKAIYLAFSTAATSHPDASGKVVPTEAEAKAKAEDLVKQARAGADFVKLVKENSEDPTSVAKDGDFPPIRKADTKVPPDILKALFAAKQGEVTDPVRQPRGFYVFRIEESGPQPLEQVQQSIRSELQNELRNKWLEDFKKGIEVKMAEGPAPAQAAPVPSASAVPAQK